MPDSLVAAADAVGASRATEASALVVVGSADSCTELMAHPQFGQADVVLLELAEAQCGVPLIERLLHQSGAKLVVLAVARDPSRLRDALSPREGLDGGEHAADGGDSGAASRPGAGSTLASTPAAILLRRRSSSTTPRAHDTRAQTAPSPHGLTAKEREVVRQMVQHRGTKNHAIALELGISEHTLRNHLTVIYSKLGVHGKLNLYVYALEHGLASPESASSAVRPMRRWRPGDPDRRARPAN